MCVCVYVCDYNDGNKHAGQPMRQLKQIGMRNYSLFSVCGESVFVALTKLLLFLFIQIRVHKFKVYSNAHKSVHELVFF